MKKALLWPLEGLLAVMLLVLLLGRPSEAQVFGPGFNPFGGFIGNLSTPGCTSQNMTFIGDRFKAVVKGSRVTVHPQLWASNSSEPIYADNVSYVLQLVSLAQQAPTTLPYPLTCIPDYDYISQSINLADCTTCSITSWNDTSNPNYYDTYFTLSMSNCSPTNNFTILINISTTNVDHYSTYVEPDSLKEIKFFHPANGIKFGVEIHDWNWVRGLYMGPYVSGRFQLGFEGQGNTTFGIYTESDEFCFNLLGDGYNSTICFEKYFVLNNSISEGLAPPPFPPVPFDLKLGDMVMMEQNFSFCPPNNTAVEDFPTPPYIFYDPTLEFLFDPTSAPQDPSAPPTNSPSGNNYRNTAIAVSISVIVAVGATTIALVLLFKYVPAVKHFFRPFSKPHRGGMENKVNQPILDSSSNNNYSNANGWHSGQKPAQ